MCQEILHTHTEGVRHTALRARERAYSIPVCMCMWVCVRVYVGMCACVWGYVFTGNNVYRHINVCIQTFIQKYMHVHMQTDKQTYVKT